MLHELLLSLSGHPSPLLKTGTQSSESLRSLLSPAELALLGSLAEDLGGKHKSIRDTATTISTSHPSTSCRAVASAIISIHLAGFQQRILEVEKDILNEDAGIVGAYNIVPLSAIVGSFDGWGRKLKWLWELVQFIQTPVLNASQRIADGQRTCTAAILIERLRGSMHTGYPDIENMSLNLVKVAETTWLKQVSAWVLYGQHPAAKDFFVTSGEGNGEVSNALEAYTVTESLLPRFVTPYTANSILFVGKSLNHIRERQRSNAESTSKTTSPELALLPAHLAQLSALQSPIGSGSFSAAINAIRLSLSQKVLQKLLPMSKVLDVLYILKDFFLLERGEFAVALITAADERLNPGYHRGARSQKAVPNLGDNLASLTIKEGEVRAVLARTWTALASLRGDQDDEDVDEELDHARDLISLSIKSIESSGSQNREHTKEQAPAFDDLLLPSSTGLSIKVPSPLDLFLSVEDTEVYSRIHAYLIAIRRAHLRLSKLFLLSKLRRDYPCPRAHAHLSELERMTILERKRNLSTQRTKAMRSIWASIGSASFFLAEVGEYFQGEIIQRSWTAFLSWLTPSIRDRPKSSDNSFTSSFLSASLHPGSSRLGSRPTSSRHSEESASHGLHDPESLTQAHKRYLRFLEHSLLLENATFTRPLRRLLTATDHIAALMQRLDAIQTSLDIEMDAGSDHATSHYPAEELRLMSDLRASLPKISNGVHELVEVLRTIDNDRTSGKATAGLDQGVGVSMDGGGFVPWSSKGLDRLLLKFDYGNVEKLSLQQLDWG